MNYIVIFVVITAPLCVQSESDQFEVLKITNVPFPSVTPSWPPTIGSTIAASANASYVEDIAEFTVCYRFQIESYNVGGMSFVFAAGKDGGTADWNVLDRMNWKNSGEVKGAEGYQGGMLSLQSRGVPGGGIGRLTLPAAHTYMFPRDIEISKWNNICWSYSSILHHLHMFKDGLKVLGFNFGDEIENPLPSNYFETTLLGWNMRGLITDLHIYASYFNEEELTSWTTGCESIKGEIFSWDLKKLNLTKEGVFPMY